MTRTERASAPRRPGYSLPVFERLAPPPPPALLVARIELHTGPGDVVADLAGRGGWVARAAVDRQRRAISIESTPLTRMLAEVVLRPPDVRHLDAAFQGMAASPRGESEPQGVARRPVRDALRDLRPDARRRRDHLGPDGDAMASRRARSTRGTTAARSVATSAAVRAPPGAARPGRPASGPVTDAGACARRAMAARPVPAVDGRPGPGRRAARPPHAAPARRPRRDHRADRGRPARGAGPGRAAPGLPARDPPVQPPGDPSRAGRRPLRVAGGHVRLPDGEPVARAQPVAGVRGRVPHRARLRPAARGRRARPVQARLGEDLRALGEGTATAVLGRRQPVGPARAARRARSSTAGSPPAPRVRLVLGQPPIRPSLERLGRRLPRHGLGARPGGGRAAADRRPRRVLAARPVVVAGGSDRPRARPPSSRRSPATGGSSSSSTAGRRPSPRSPSVGPRPAIRVRESPAWPIPTTTGRRRRAPAARRGRCRRDRGRGRTSGCAPVPGGAGRSRTWCPGRGLFAPPERFDQRPFSAAEAARVVTDAAVETSSPRRAGPLRAAVRRDPRRASTGPGSSGGWRPRPSPADGAPTDDRRVGAAEPAATGGGAGGGAGTPPRRTRRDRRRAADPRAPTADGRRRATAGRTGRDAAPDPVERLLALIRDELGAAEPAPPRRDRARALVAGRPRRTSTPPRRPSPIGSSGPCSACCRPPARSPRRRSTSGSRRCSPATTCPTRRSSGPASTATAASASTPDRLVTRDDLLRRSQEHTELLAAIADAGHRLGMRVWLGRARAGPARRGRGLLGDLLDERERRCLPRRHQPGRRRARRGRRASGTSAARSRCCSRSSGPRCSASRCSAGMPGSAPTSGSSGSWSSRPERTDLVRYKLERSPLLRAALDDGDWNIVKSDHLRTFLAARPAGPRRPRAVPRPGSGRRASGRADAAVRRLTARGGRHAPPRPAIERAAADARPRPAGDARDLR